MKYNQQDTPPSSLHGDDIAGMEDEDGMLYYEEVEEIDLEDLQDEGMDGIMEQEEDAEPPEDHAAVVFTKHTGSVFCCDLHPSGKVAATGGEDDKAYVWSVETGQLVMECTGHKDSVIFVGFSFDGCYLATVDMVGLIKVWKCPAEGESHQGPWTVAFEYEAEDLSWGLWHFGARVLICGAVSGDIYVFKIPSGDTKVLQGHHSRTECGKLFPDGVRLCSGYEDGVVKVWDLKSSAVLQQVPAGVHPGRVTAVDIHPDNNLMVSVSSDGTVVLTTSSTGKVVGQIEGENDMEAISFSKDVQLGFFALGTLNGAVNIWDAARRMMRHDCAKTTDDAAAGVTKIFWIKNHLVTGCLDGSVRLYEGRTGERKLMLTGHRSEILDLCYNEKENIILTSSDDGSARIFKYDPIKDND
ncbi:angio-associated migratory cell protein [Plutella xylostella]|uniref:angio-associated migratory cell protein n=1 Tax=Plutella xylostella TaxID=51655 RepID=UPI002032BC08|nr:angio-associated migratory cell protein [Plutella xylostella]